MTCHAIARRTRGRIGPARVLSGAGQPRLELPRFRAGRDVGTAAATQAYIGQVLPEAPEPLDGTLNDAAGPLDLVTGPPAEAAAASGELA